ncbi:hypothetical protein V494_03013 [Pseudogymnoascus sp. VKM F-4513 (FW-928)]|nr:hypothetical protein V494_03013 [Pseudogymnoascus sp. VKM F-4513 (FW-928)]
MSRNAYALEEDRPSERSRWPPLTRMLMSGEMNAETKREYNWKEKYNKWMVNEGYRRFFVFVFAAIHAMVFAFGFMNYQLKDNLQNGRDTFGLTYPIARAAALVLHFDIAVILFPVCRTLISLARKTPLNGIIQFDKNITFHKMTAWSIVFFSWVHTIAHWNNFAQIAAKNNLGFVGFLLANFATGPGWSGYVMLTALMAMAITSMEKFRRANFERFWYTHHLFVIFFLFWSIHGAFCMIKPDFAPFCVSIGSSAIGVFWQYWMYGGYIYLAERIAREVRGRHKTYISKVVQHPSNVCEIQIKKEHTKTRAGQYIFFCCPEVSLWQYHPFTLTSAPEEDYISIHIRMVGDFTKAVGKALGCEVDRPRGGAKKDTSQVIGVNKSSPDATTVDPALRRVLPRVYIDGPFGSASEDVFKYETAVLVGAGIGVTPFASILKSIWYRMNYPQKKTRLRKVYFFWVCRDFGSFEWFRSLLLAIEAQDMDNHIEIHTYLTAKIQADDATNIMINDANADRDAITGLRAPTNFGRPNWGAVFRSIRKIHSPGASGVFFCGPKGLGSSLHVKCNEYSDPDWSYLYLHSPQSAAEITKTPNPAIMRVAFFSTKHYDEEAFNKVNESLGSPLEITYLQASLNLSTVALAKGHKAVSLFVNDTADAEVLKALSELGVEIIALRCAGTDNVDLPTADTYSITTLHVPSYSPHAVAEFAIGLLLTLVRKYHKAFNRTREGNFSLSGLVGFNLHGKTVGIIGTGQIGLLVAKILSRGFGCRVVAYDLYPNEEKAVEYGFSYKSRDEVLKEADILSLHCPLTPSSHHLLNDETLALTKPGVVIINTSRGGLIDTKSLIRFLKSGHIGALGLDVYEGEKEYFFRDGSRGVIQDDDLTRLMSFYNVVISGHQAFLSREALEAIAEASVGDVVKVGRGEEVERRAKVKS